MGATAVTPAAPPRRGPLGGVSVRLLRVASDEKLVAAVRQGSQPAFEVLYDRHHRGILSFCRHMLGSREEAEDALQHTFMAAYKGLLASDKDMQLKAWLYTIARNRCLSVLRARREQPSADIEIASVDGLGAQVQRKVELQDMLRDLAELPEDQREALVLSEIGDLGHDEIGRVLDIPRDKVKALVFQARSSLLQSREARDTSCEEIREMLATLSGGALRRTTLRRHVKECAGCQAFESEVKRQRRAMAAVLPVVPTLGLKENALAAAFGQSVAGGAVVAGGAAATGVVAGGSAIGGGASALVAKVLVVSAVAGGGVAGVSAVSDGGPDRPRSTPASETAPPARGGTPIVPAATAEAEEQAEKASGEKPRKDAKARKRGRDARGKALAETRGKGNKRGLRGTQPGRQSERVAKAKEKAEKRKAREKSADQKAVGRAKAKAKTKARRERPAKQPAKPPAQDKPKNEPEQKPEPKPDPTPEPTPEPSPTADPSATPDPPGKSHDG